MNEKKLVLTKNFFKWQTSNKSEKEDKEKTQINNI